MHTGMDTPLGARIMVARGYHGWSQSELSRRSGITQPQISKLEAGETAEPSASTAVKIAGALQVSTDALLVGSEQQLLDELARLPRCEEDSPGSSAADADYATTYRSSGVAPPEFFDELAGWVDRRANILICGTTAAGKTSLLQYTAGLCDPADRLVVIEDRPELQIDHPQVRSLHRASTAPGASPLSMSTLIRRSTKMEPAARLIIGEVRAREAYDAVAVMRAGHDGALMTMHAPGAEQAIGKLVSLSLRQRGGDAVRSAARAVAESLDVIICVQRDGDRRIVAQVAQVLMTTGGNAFLHPLWSFTPLNDYAQKVYDPIVLGSGPWSSR